MTDLAFSEKDLQTFYSYTEDLEHHGILGMKWGKRNGPPYPLDDDDHSASERKAGWRKSLDDAKQTVKTVASKAGDTIRKRKEIKESQNAEKNRLEEEAEKQKRYADKLSVIRSGDPIAVAEYASEMTVQEFREAVDRLDLQRKLNAYLPQQEVEKTFQQKVSDVVSTGKTYLNLYNSVAEMSNAVFNTELPIFTKEAREKMKNAVEEKEKKELQRLKSAAERSTAEETIAKNRESARKRAEAEQKRRFEEDYKNAKVEDMKWERERKNENERKAREAEERERVERKAREAAENEAVTARYNAKREAEQREEYRKNLSSYAYDSDTHARNLESMAKESTNKRFDDLENNGFRNFGTRSYESARKDYDEIESYGYSSKRTEPSQQRRNIQTFNSAMKTYSNTDESDWDEYEWSDYNSYSTRHSDI